MTRLPPYGEGCFHPAYLYMDRGGHRVTRAMFGRNLAVKLGDPQFGADVSALGDVPVAVEI